MGMQTSNILLDAQGIDESSEALWDFLVGAELDRRSALSARLTFESALLRLRERFGDGTPAELVMGSRFGRPVVMARVKGERFDPREVGDETPWERSLMEASGMRPVYAYRGGINIVSISGPLRISSMAQSAAAITLGVVLGFSGRFMQTTCASTFWTASSARSLTPTSACCRASRVPWCFCRWRGASAASATWWR